MVQPEERLTARISFYTKPSIDERLDQVVSASPWEKPDWLRHWLEDTLVRLETEELLGDAVWRMRLLRCSSLRRWHRSRGWSRSMGC